jgi:hypothetical protein
MFSSTATLCRTDACWWRFTPCQTPWGWLAGYYVDVELDQKNLAWTHPQLLHHRQPKIWAQLENREWQKEVLPTREAAPQFEGAREAEGVFEGKGPLARTRRGACVSIYSGQMRRERMDAAERVNKEMSGNGGCVSGAPAYMKSSQRPSRQRCQRASVSAAFIIPR